MLPLTITLHDLFGREKFGALPGPVAGEGPRAQVCETGDMICWTAGPDLAIFHRQDGRTIEGGFTVLGRLDFGAEAFGTPGPIDVRIALAAPAPAELTPAGCPAPAAAEGARATT